jgi:hypothetical protein
VGYKPGYGDSSYSCIVTLALCHFIYWNEMSFHSIKPRECVYSLNASCGIQHWVIETMRLWKRGETFLNICYGETKVKQFKFLKFCCHRWTASVVQWSEFLATDPEIRVRFQMLPDFLRSSVSGTGSTQPREYNRGATWKKSSGSGLETKNTAVGIRHDERMAPIIPKVWH